MLKKYFQLKMINIQFLYKGKKIKISYKKNDYTNDVLKNFASKINLNYEHLLFIYDDARINTNLDLMIEDQFNLSEKPKKEIKILVFNDNSEEDECYVKFSYNQREKIIKCSKNEKISSIWRKYASKANVNISEVYFLYNGEQINQDDLNNKTFYELANKIDKESKLMNVIVNPYRNDSIISNESNQANESFNNKPNLVLSDNLNEYNINDDNILPLLPPLNQIDTETKNYYLKFFFILIIQYSLITVLVWLSFFFNIDEVFNNNNLMKWIFISSISVLFILSIIKNSCLKQYKKNIFLYIYYITY